MNNKRGHLPVRQPVCAVPHHQSYNWNQTVSAWASACWISAARLAAVGSCGGVAGVDPAGPAVGSVGGVSLILGITRTVRHACTICSPVAGKHYHAITGLLAKVRPKHVEIKENVSKHLLFYVVIIILM